MPKISQLPTDSSPTLTDYIPTVDSETNTTKKTLLSSIRDLVFNNVPSTSSTVTGWISNVLAAPNTVSYNGGNNYTLTFNSLDYTPYLYDGMKIMATRTATAPTKCTSLNGSTQYYNKTSPSGMTFTDDFVVSAWIKISSYAASQIVSRYNGTSGWQLRLESTGQVTLIGSNAGGSNFSYVQSYQSIPLNKWVHIAAQLDMSTFTATTTTSYVMIDGVDVAASVSRGGTNPTALIQAGNLEIGSTNGGSQFFLGKIAQVAIYNAKVTQATIKASISQTLSGSETSLISAYSFNNSINDLAATANNLTAQGSAVATNSDSPFAGGANASTAYTAGTREFGEVFNVSYSTNTTVVVQVPDGYALPVSGGISAISYSTASNPLGFPASPRVLGQVLLTNNFSMTGSTPTQIYGMSITAYIPAGRRVRLTWNTYTYTTTGGLSIVSGWVGTVSSGTRIAASEDDYSTTNQGHSLHGTGYYTPSAAGSTTFNVGVNNGTAGQNVTIGASTTVPTWLTVELV